MTEPASKKRPAPIKGKAMPGSRTDLILKFFSRRKGQQFRCYQIAEKIGHPTQPVARECYRMWTRGQLDRSQVFEGGSKQATSYYAGKVKSS